MVLVGEKINKHTKKIYFAVRAGKSLVVPCYKYLHTVRHRCII